MGEEDRLTAAAEPSRDPGAITPSRDPGAAAASQEPKPAAPEPTGPDAGGIVQPTPADDTDWKAKFEERNRQYEEKTREYERLEKQARVKQSEADRQTARLQQIETERRNRVNAILGNRELYDEIKADPVRWQEFNGELVAVQMADRDSEMRELQADRDWERAERSLAHWFCTSPEGPQLTLKEFEDWNAEYGESFGRKNCATPEKGVESAKKHIIGLNIKRILERQQAIADRNADEKAKTTIRQANPPGSSSVSLGKNQTAVEKAYEELESLPRGNAAAAFFRGK